MGEDMPAERKCQEGNDSLEVCWDPNTALSSCLLLLKAAPPMVPARMLPPGLLEGGAGANIGSETTGSCESTGSLPAGGTPNSSFSSSQLGLEDLPALTGKELEKLEMGWEAQAWNFLFCHSPQTQ